MGFSTGFNLSPDSPTDVDTNTVSYVLRFADEGKGVYSVAGLTLPNEKKVTISHETTSAGIQRHMVRLDDVQPDPITAEVVTSSIYLVCVRPPSTAFTEAELIADLFQLIDFLIEGGAAANFSKVLNSET